MKIAFVGHVCIDLNEIRGRTETFYGGGVIHGSITAQRLGARSIVVTKCAETDREHWTSFREEHVEARFLPSNRSTSIRNIYPSDNPDDRQSYLVSRADPFSEADIGALGVDAIHLNPLWYGEFPCELLPAVRKCTSFLGGDAQGLLRHALEDGTMEYRDLPDKRQVLSSFDLFKVDTREAHILTGETDVRSAARAVRDLGPRVVLLTHRGGVCAFDGSEYCESPFTAFTLEGRTGRGDTCTGAFLAAMRNMSLCEATALAAEVTSRKMQYRGPYRG